MDLKTQDQAEQAVNKAGGLMKNKVGKFLAGNEASGDEQPSALVKGDYTVQVHIIECRDLKGSDFGDRCDPVCEIKVDEKKKSTAVHKECLGCVFDEMVVFSLKNQEPEELEQKRVTVSIYDANMIRSNTLVGLYSLDLTSIYYKKHHELYKQWLALSDITKPDGTVTGYIRVTIHVLGPGDEPYVHEGEEEEEDSEPGELLNVLMPPQIESAGKQLGVHIHRLTNLPIMDSYFGSCDPYVLAKFAGATQKSRVEPKKRNVDFDEQLLIPIWEPTMSKRIVVQLWDEDLKGLNDDLIGTWTYDYDNLKQMDPTIIKGDNPGNEFEAKDIPEFEVIVSPVYLVHYYGAPIGFQDGIANKMNMGYMEGSWYRGSALLHFELEDDDEPDPGTDISEWKKGMEIPKCNYALQVDVYQAAEVKGNTAFRLVVRIGDIESSTSAKEKDSEYGLVEWIETLKNPRDGTSTLTYLLPLQREFCPDVCLYLMDGDEIYSYKRIKFDDIFGLGFDAPPMWFNFKEEPNFDLCDEEKGELPGIVLLGIRCGYLDKVPRGIPSSARPFIQTAEDSAVLDFGEMISDRSDSIVSTRSVSRTRSAATAVIDMDPTQESGTAALYGDLKITLHKAVNIPKCIGRLQDQNRADPFLSIKVADRPKKNTKVHHDEEPSSKDNGYSWHEEFIYKNVHADATVQIKLLDWNQLKNDEIGRARFRILSASDKPLGMDFACKKKRFFIELEPYIKRKEKKRIAKARKAKMAQMKKAGDLDVERLRLEMEDEQTKECKIEVSIEFKYNPDYDGPKTHPDGKEKKSLMRMFTRSKKGRGGLVSNLGEMGRPVTTKKRMICYCYQARNLEGKDNNGLSDPYLVVQYGGNRMTTRTVNANVNPQWLEEIECKVYVPQMAEFAPDIQFFVYDKDIGPLKDDLIGHFSLPYLDALEMTKPRWFQLHDVETGDEVDGEVYIAVEFLDSEAHDYRKFEINKETKTYYLYALTLGIRNVTASFGVHKAQVEYSTNTGKLYKTNPSASPSPKNANFIQVQKIPLQLPISAEMAPCISVAAKDLMLGGYFPQLIGTCTIPLQNFMFPDGAGSWHPKHAQNEIVLEDKLILEIDEEAAMEAEAKEKWMTAIEERAEAAAHFRAEKFSWCWFANTPYNEKNDNKALKMGETYFGGSASSKRQRDPLRDKWSEGSYVEVYVEQLQDWFVGQITQCLLEEGVSILRVSLNSGGKMFVDRYGSLVRGVEDSDSESESETPTPDEVITVTQAETDIDFKQIQETKRASKKQETEPSGRLHKGGDVVSLADKLDAENLSSDDAEQLTQRNDGGKQSIEMAPLNDDALGSIQNENEEDLAEIPVVDSTEIDMQSDEESSSLMDSDDSQEALLKDGKDQKKMSRRDKKQQRKKQKKDDWRKVNKWASGDDECSYNITDRMKEELDVTPPYLKGRPVFNKRLEEIIDCNPFDSFTLMKGQKGGSRWLNNQRREVGKLKGLWKLSPLDKDESFGEGLRVLLEQRAVVVQLYILKGIKLFPLDRDNKSDPYIVVKLGKKKFSTRSRHKNNTLDPLFHEAFEFRTRLPGASQLIIEIWDWDGIGDDLIGIAEIDIEDRWFSKEWRKLEPKPVEVVPIYNSRSTGPYGHISLWLDMFSQVDARNFPLQNITLPPPEKWQLRVIIWKAWDVVCMDEVTSQNDLFVRCKLDIPISMTNPTKMMKFQDTDLHFRAKWGIGSWNWRMLFDIEVSDELFLKYADMPMPFSVQMYDKDFFSADDLICETRWDFRDLLMFAFRKKERVVLKQWRRDYGRQYESKLIHLTEMFHPSHMDEGTRAKLQISVELLPPNMIEEIQAGPGRDAPNTNPHLPEPDFRFEWTMNPFSLIRQLVGDKMCAKMCMCCCAAFCIAMLFISLPNILSSMLASAIG